MTKPDKTAQDAPERPEISRHAVILFRDGRALAANQAPGNEPKTELFDLREYRQNDLCFQK